MRISILWAVVALVFVGLVAGEAYAQIPPPEKPEHMLSTAYTGPSYSPYAARDFATHPLWGRYPPAHKQLV